MERKAHNTALKNRFFLGLWFVIFTTVVLSINWLFTKPLNKITLLREELAVSDKHIARLQSIQAEFLLNLENTDNLLITPEKTTEEEAGSLLRSLKRDLDHFSAHKYLRTNSAIMTSLDEYSNAVSWFENSLNDFFLIAHERGNVQNGIISRWRELSNRMLSVPNPPEAGIMKALNQIKLSESNYLLQKDARMLEEISVLCEEIRGQLSSEEGGIDVADLDGYMALTGNLIALDKRIGDLSTGGVRTNLSESHEALQASFQNTQQLILDRSEKLRFRWNVAHYAMLALIVIVFIYLFIRMTNNLFFRPLKHINDITRQMAQGEFPKKGKNSWKYPDFISIEDSLLKLVTHLEDKTDFTRSLNERKMDSGLTLSGENDILGKELISLREKIIQAAEHQQKNEEENLRRRYINEGLAKFADILRTRSNDINALGDAFIREIVKYLNAIQGGFFLFDDTDRSAPVLNLVSAFAYNRKKYLQKTLAYGEGLVGTCAREKATINLTEIPENYISITSGLGDTLPDNLLLIPVVHENEILGVLEIASLHKFKPHEIEFSESLAHNLGATIVYTRNNQRTADLLAKSQQQALEMAEQEEEMRQNMEELKATQEESSRREEEFKGIADAIDNALFVVEYDLNGHILQANERFCNFIGRFNEDIAGHTHQEVFGGSLKPDQQFWEEIQTNLQYKGMEQIKIGKKTVTLKEHFTTVQNRDGITVKYINFATE